MKNTVLILLLLASVASPGLRAETVTDVQNLNRAPGATAFRFEIGEQLWLSKHGDRDCTRCHGPDLTQPGKHNRTGKRIEPMAPSVNKDRFTDSTKVEKWFKRNCKWTWGRECTAQEKGDLLEYLRKL